MKKIYLLIIFLILSSCGLNPIKKAKNSFIDCPSILFATEHKNYIGNTAETVTLDTLSYQAQINNAIFNSKCQIYDNVFSADLSILFIVNSLDQLENIVKLPFYIAVLDSGDALQEIQYFSAKGKFKKNINNSLIETDVITNKKISFKSLDKFSKIVIGFMIDENRLKFLN